MKKPISLRRRQLMIAGMVGAAAPASVFARQCAGLAADAAPVAYDGAGSIVVSGRVVDAQCRALAGALVEAAPGVTATADADGRFMLALPAARGSLEVRVRHQGYPAQVARLARFERDETGTRRATLGVTLA